MNKFCEAMLKYRILIILVTIAITVFFGIGLTRLWINSDIFTYLKPDDPAVKLFNRIGEDFKGNFLVMVGIETDNVFTAKSLKLIKELTDVYKNIDGITSVMSLINILDIRKNEGMLEVGNLIDEENIPETPKDLERLRSYVMSKEMYRGKIVSIDGKITLIVCRIKPDVNKIQVAKQIITSTKPKQNQAKFYYSGLPIQMTDMLATIKNDVIRLVPFVSIVIIIVLFASFYSIRGVLLPLIAVLLSTTWSMGLMGWIGTPLSMISNAMPVVLIAIGSAYGIHFISKYYEDVQQDGNSREVSKKALRDTLMPILLAGVTTLTGFLSFVGSYLTAITEFGIYMAIGTSFAIIISIIFIPAVISFMKVKEGSNDRRIHLFTKMMKLVSQIVLKHRIKILVVTAIIAIISIFSLPMIKREVDMLEYFSETSDTRISEEMMRLRFGGSIPIQIVIKGDMKDPFVLKKIRQIEKYIASFEYISNTQSIADLICQMNDVMNGHYTIPETREGVANLWFFIEGQEILEQLVNNDLTEGLIQGRISTQNSRKTLQIVKTIDEYISRLNKEGNIVLVSKIDPSSINKIKDWLSNEISEMIYYDAIGRFPEIDFDKNLIKSSVREILEDDNIKLAREQIKEFDNEIMEFFSSESDLILSSDEEKNKIIRIVLDSVISGNIHQSDFENILKRNLNLNGENLESLDSTSETLAVKARDIINKSRVESAINRLALLFPKDVANSQYFRDDLREDLWTINEELWAIPKDFAVNGIVGKYQISVTQAGSPVIYRRFDQSLLKSQIQSLIIAFVMVFVILTIQFRSIKSGLIATSPIVMTVLVNFAIMAFSKTPLDIATMMVSGIAIGVGIDYAIHFTNRLKVEFNQNSDIQLAVAKTLNTTGKAIMTNAFSIAFGLLVLLMAQLIPMQRFGWMVASTMIISSLATITYMPSMMLVSHIENNLVKRNNVYKEDIQ